MSDWMKGEVLIPPGGLPTKVQAEIFADNLKYQIEVEDFLNKNPSLDLFNQVPPHVRNTKNWSLEELYKPNKRSQELYDARCAKLEKVFNLTQSLLFNIKMYYSSVNTSEVQQYISLDQKVKRNWDRKDLIELLQALEL